MSDNVQQADLKTVVKDLEEVVEKNPQNVMAHHQLGLVYRQVGRVEDAIKELEMALELDDQSVESLINLGAIYFDRGDVEKALSLNEQALRVAPDMAEAHVNIGLIRQQQNRVDEAIESYVKATQIVPSLITGWINLTSAYTMNEEDEKAVEAARQAVTIDPDSGMARNNLAVALYFSTEYSESKKNMEKASELGYSVDPRFAQALDEKLSSCWQRRVRRSSISARPATSWTPPGQRKLDQVWQGFWGGRRVRSTDTNFRTT